METTNQNDITGSAGATAFMHTSGKSAGDWREGRASNAKAS